MGFRNDKRWFDIIRCGILGLFSVHESDGDDLGVGAEIKDAESDNPEVRAVPEAGPPAPQPDAPHVDQYNPPKVPEDVAPQVLGAMSDGTSMMYVQTAFWVAAYVQQRSLRGDFSQDQLIEQFGVNVRRCINPDWRPEA